MTQTIEHETEYIITPEKARRHLLAWNMLSSGGMYLPFWHNGYLCKRLMDIVAGRGRSRLLIQIPPQHGKSTTATEGLATYFLGRNPAKRVAICSYSADLAEDFGYRNRCRMEEYGHAVFGVTVDAVHKSRGNWSIKGYPTGGMVSVGVGGPLTGKRVDCLILDDLIKNFEEAQSAYVRDSVWNWLVTVAMTRLSKYAPVVAIGTRWHPDDHLGRLIRLSESGSIPPFDVISLSAIADEDEHDDSGNLLRRAGDPLCPELHPIEKLMEVKRYMSDFQWSALYQQQPTTPEGCQWSPELFNERIMVDDWPPDLEHMVLAIDPSSGRDQKKGDYPAVCILGTRGDGLFYVDYIMEKANPTRVVNNIITYLAGLRQRGIRTPGLIGVEAPGYSELYAEKLVNALIHSGNFIPMCEISHESRDKTLRIQRLDPFVSNRELRFLRTAGSLLAIEQFKNFPTGKWDDACDATEMAFRILPRVV